MQDIASNHGRDASVPDDAGPVAMPLPVVSLTVPADVAFVEPAEPVDAVDSTDTDATDPMASDGSIYGDQDDAQSFIQPSISPMATRLSSTKTPAAERAKALRLGTATAEGPASSTPAAPRRSLTVRAAMMQAANRHGRSSSVSADAFKRLSKALPSLSFPKSPGTFFPNLPTPSFFSSTVTSPTSPTTPSPKHQLPLAAQTAKTSTSSDTAPPVAKHSPPAAAVRPPSFLHRSTSDDELLYHSLSRVSSLGDTDNFEHIREQVNSRVKAIKDSFPDRPSFKLPNFFPDGKTAASTSREPASPLDAVLDHLIGDVVVLGGYRGSILRSAERPHRQLWVPVKVGLNIRQVNLEVGLDPEDEENMEQSIFASGMLQHIGPVDISRRLFRKLRESDNARRGKLRVHDYGYDWRLSPHLLSKRLIAFLEKLHCNTAVPPGSPQRGALVIAHSLGGLITRHAVNQRPDLFSGVIFAGTPQRCINILGPLRNGDAVLLNEKVLTAAVHFSLRTTFVFLPEDGYCFINSERPEEEYHIDFYNVDDWIRYRLSPCIGPPASPPLRPDSSSDGAEGTNGTTVHKRSSTIGALLDEFSVSLPSLPLRSRISSTSSGFAEGSSGNRAPPPSNLSNVLSSTAAAAAVPLPPSPGDKDKDKVPDSPEHARRLAYLKRTLAETKQFRAELAHRPEHTAANAYPPLAVIYGKGIPTVYASRVHSRATISCTDAYDDLAFRSGDGVVLAREAMVPEGYHVVRNGHVSTDRGHVSMLGDHAAVGRALEAVLRGRKKGIGLGHPTTDDDKAGG